MSDSASVPLPPPEVLEHVIDAHCHPTDSPTPAALMSALHIRVCTMSTRTDDQAKVAKLAETYPQKVIPCFGYHPWFAHTISLLDPAPDKKTHYESLLLSPNDVSASILNDMLDSLPTPRTLSDILTELRHNLTAHPHALVGEVGIDRSFRLPLLPYPSPPGRRLSPFAPPLSHQLAILEAQIGVAIELGRNISLHSVKCTKDTVDLLARLRARFGEKWGRVNLDLHSCGLSVETWKEISKSHPNVFISLSTAINARSSHLQSLIASSPPDRILTESDWHDIARCTGATWEMVLLIAEVKGWKVEDRWEEEEEEGKEGAVRRLERNWELFTGGGRGLSEPSTGNRKQRKRRDYALNTDD